MQLSLKVNGLESHWEYKDAFSPPHSSIYLKKGKVRFAYGIDGLAEWRNELNNLVEQPDNAASAYDKKINAEKTKVITDDKQDIYRDIDIKDKPLEEVAKFKFIGSAISVEGSKQEITAKTAQISARIVIYLSRPVR